jgi:arylformamidase
MAARETIWLDYTQDELDRQYDQRVLVPDADDYMARWGVESERLRQTLDCRLDVPYGETEAERLDIFPAAAEGAPVVVYFHGGAWTRWNKANNSYQAVPFTAAGATFVSVDFALVPAVALDELIRQCRASVAWVHENAAGFGADPDRLHIAGHSSGGHEVAMLATTDWTRWGLPGDAVKGAFAASGIYDLEPVRLSSRNRYLSLDAEATRRNSPIHHIRDAMPAMVIAYGEDEQREFRRQSIIFAQALRDRGHAVRELDLNGLNHFQVAEQYGDAGTALMRAVLDGMGLAA